MKLPMLTERRIPASSARRGATMTCAGVSPARNSTMANCSTRCAEGWCRECCPGVPCVNYPDPNVR